MNIRKIIQRRIRSERGGVKGVGDVNAVISANVGSGASSTHFTSRSRQRIVQRSGRTEVSEEFDSGKEGGDWRPEG